MLEHNLQDRIRLFISESKLATMFHNNVGFDKVHKIKYGLCVGSSDIIGWQSKIITPDMVGKKVAVFTAIELKVENRKSSDKQRNFINRVNLSGGIAGVVRNVNDVEKLLGD